MRRCSSYYEKHNNKRGRSKTQAELGSSEQPKCDLREEIREGPSEKDKCELRFEDVEKNPVQIPGVTVPRFRENTIQVSTCKRTLCVVEQS